MEEKERFYFTEIEKTFLQNAAPEYVYEWIKKHFGNQGDSFFKILKNQVSFTSFFKC